MTSDAVLRVEEATKKFGAVVAVDNVSFTIQKGEIKSLIGPNGAGKTTLFNCISGVLPLTEGSVRFGEEEITGLRPDEIAHRGISRSYQINNLFDEFTVSENIRLAIQIQGDNNRNFWSDYRSFEDPVREAREIIDRIGLTEQADKEVTSLSHGQKRQLEIGLGIATEPKLLLLDEPTSGLATENIDTVINLIESIREDYTIMLVEHNMDVVMNVSDSIMVMDNGQLIADGSPEEVRESQEVQEAYLGTDEETFTESDGDEVEL